jgi:transposase
MPVRFFITGGTEADCNYAIPLIEGVHADYLLADRGYDSNSIIQFAKTQHMQVIIPPRKNRMHQRKYDKYLYKLRHRVENAFLYIKRWRGIATRYPKNTASFVAAVQIRCIAIWANIS